MNTFEAAIFNEDVRNLVAENRHHEVYDDVWADLNFIEVTAADEDEAREKLGRRYPERRGFRITQIYAA